MTSQTITRRATTGRALAVTAIGVVLALCLALLFARHAAGVDARHLLHGIGLLPGPVRNLLGGAELSHLAH